MTTLDRQYPALQGEFESEYEAESEYSGHAEHELEFEFESAAIAELEAEGELEDEFEDEDEGEGFANPIRRVYRDAETMAHLARQATMAESHSEAEAFIGALVPLAATLIPRAAQLMLGNAPTLVRSATRLTRRLRRNPSTRRLVYAMPVVLQRTAQSLADQADAGGAITPQTVIRTLAAMSDHVLRGSSAPRAMQAVDVFDRRWHRRRRWASGRTYQYGRGPGLSTRYPVGRGTYRRRRNVRAR